MKRVVIVQSNYIPWKGYFDLINDADLFIFHDDIQYTKNDWRNRNRVKGYSGVGWITVPVGSSTDRKICDVEIESFSWQRKHWNVLLNNYRKCPFFGDYQDFFEDFFLVKRWNNLSVMNQYLIRYVSAELLGIKTQFKDSREYSLVGKKQDRVLEALIKAGASQYISGPAAKDYIEPGIFEKEGIDLVWKDYSGYPGYPQRFSGFDHNVSIVDLLFNVGSEAPWYIWGWRGANG